MRLRNCAFADSNRNPPVGYRLGGSLLPITELLGGQSPLSEGSPDPHGIASHWQLKTESDPKQSSNRLLDHLVGAHQHGSRNSEREPLRRLCVDDELEVCRLLDRQFARKRTVQDADDVIRTATPQLGARRAEPFGGRLETFFIGLCVALGA
jgi:hypothetical protein